MWRPFSFVYIRFPYCFRSVTSGLRHPSPLTCAVVHAATFAVNAALVASQWQHRAWTVALLQSINAEHEAGHAAHAVFQVFVMIRPGIEPSLAALMTCDHLWETPQTQVHCSWNSWKKLVMPCEGLEPWTHDPFGRPQSKRWKRWWGRKCAIGQNGEADVNHKQKASAATVLRQYDSYLENLSRNRDFRRCAWTDSRWSVSASFQLTCSLQCSCQKEQNRRMINTWLSVNYVLKNQQDFHECVRRDWEDLRNKVGGRDGQGCKTAVRIRHWFSTFLSPCTPFIAPTTAANPFILSTFTRLLRN